MGRGWSGVPGRRKNKPRTTQIVKSPSTEFAISVGDTKVLMS